MVKASGTITLTRVNDGATGNGISSNTPEYYLSTSKTTQAGGSWVTTPPIWVSGKYMWTRLKTIYTDGKVVYSIPFCDTAWEVANDVKGEMITYVNTSVGKITTEVDAISLRVEKDSGTIYKFETGSGNIFDKCQRYLEKDSKILTELTNSDMPLAINLSYLQGKDICISVDIQAINAITKSLRGFVGAEFSIVYMDNTTAKFATYFVPGTFMLEYWTDLGLTSLSKRIYTHYKIEDKPLKSITNLQLTIACNGQKIIASNPKVEIGTYPTGFEFEMQEARDNITTLDKEFSLIDQKVDYLSLQSVSMTEEVTTIKGDVSTVQTRLNSTDLKLTPTVITAMVNEKIGADGQLKTTKVTIDKSGLNVYGGGIKIYNNSNTPVFFADDSGNLTLSATIKYAQIDSANINISQDARIGKILYLGSATDTSSYRYISLNGGVVVPSSDVAGDVIAYKSGEVIIHSKTKSSISASQGTGAMAGLTCEILSNGTPAIRSSTQITVSSDIRKKRNIYSIDTNWIDDLHVVEFEYNDSNSKEIGLIAQEYIDKSYAKYFINQDSEGFYGIQYGNITNALIKYCQTMRKDIINLNREIAQLKGRI